MFSSLENPPKSNDTFLWADYIEVLAITHPDKCFSKGDLSGLSRRLATTDRKINYEERWRDFVNFVNTRVVSYGDFYPFEISQDQDTITFNFNGSPEQHAYVGLLIASSLRLVETGVQVIGNQFEEASLEVFKALQPAGAEVRATWAGGGTTVTYTGTLFEKMQQIARDIRCTANFEEDDYHPRDRGDGGIDLIAWHPMEDSRGAIPISFAQCGCSTTDWTFKQLEAHPAKHIARLPVTHPWAAYYFMPLDLRKVNGDFAKKSDIGQAIIVDRLRILKLAKKHNALQKFPAMHYVNQATAYTNPNY